MVKCEIYSPYINSLKKESGVENTHTLIPPKKWEGRKATEKLKKKKNSHQKKKNKCMLVFRTGEWEAEGWVRTRDFLEQRAATVSM